MILKMVPFDVIEIETPTEKLSIFVDGKEKIDIKRGGK